jgi:glycosyltransferase involved in cell wall biosynthesis
VVLDILGDGPEMPKLRAIVEHEGLAAGVRLDGWVAHKELHERLSQSTVLCFPSVREFGGAVVMEAMAMGLVPIVVDYGGPSEVVTEAAGYRVPVGSREEIIAGVRTALERLALAPAEEIVERSRRARARIESDMSLESKTQKTRDIYHWVLERAARPNLVPPSHALALYA